MATWVPISGTAIQYAKNAGGAAAADYYLKFYAAGTTTAISMATTSSGVTTLDKCKVDSNGWAVNGSDDPFIPHIDRDYKLVLYTNATDADNDTTGSAAWVIDNLSAEGLDKTYTSVAALRDSSGNDSFNVIEIESYYEITYPSAAGPKGGHRRHRTGGTNTSPTVGSPVAVSTIGTGTQAGYVWDGDGVEWKISLQDSIPITTMGGLPNSDNTTAINDATQFLLSEQTGGEVLCPAGINEISSTVLLYKGIEIKGTGYPSADAANESTIFRLSNNANCTMFKSSATDLPFLGVSNALLDGNKANQGAGSWHGVEALGLDVANRFKNLKIQDFKGKGFYANNTSVTEQGTYYLNRIDVVRCDEGGIVTEGNTQNPTLNQCSAEGNGLTTTGQFVFIDCGRFSTARLVDCRSECRAQAAGGGISAIEVIDANESDIEIVGGFHQFTEDCQALVRISQNTAPSSEARVTFKGFQTTNTASDVVLIKNLATGDELKESQINDRATDVFWEKYPVYRAANNNNTFYEKINANNDSSSFHGGNPNPNGTVVANKGSLYERISGGTFSELYMKVADDGANTGWVGVTGHNSDSFVDADTTPSVASGEGIYSFGNYTSPATITNFDDEVILGRKIELFNPTANNITIQDGTNIKLTGSVNFVMGLNSSLTLRKSGTFWYEVSRA